MIYLYTFSRGRRLGSISINALTLFLALDRCKVRFALVWFMEMKKNNEMMEHGTNGCGCVRWELGLGVGMARSFIFCVPFIP
jgi:hypothetical protein